MKNVFVLSTGRCGSLTFTKACKHFTNFTSAHESRSGLVGDERFAYPDYHIESDNRLSWLLGRLDKHFGDDAFYVHLTRNPEEVAASYAERLNFNGSIMFSYKEAILLPTSKIKRTYTSMEYALDYVSTVNVNFADFLEDKSKQMHIELETAKEQFSEFADRIGANGDLNAALAEFDVRHNARHQDRA